MQNTVLKLDPRDNVLIALVHLRQGDSLEFEGKSYQLVTNVPAKHKFATQDLPEGGAVTMYGVLVGKARKPIRQAERLTTSNVQHHAAPFREQSGTYQWAPPDVARWRQRTFLGYHRADGQVGTRNYWLVVPVVSCENRNIGVLKQAFEEELGFAAPQVYRQQVAALARLYKEGRAGEIVNRVGTPKVNGSSSSPIFENIDGIKFLLHEGGCGGTREDANNLCGLLAGYIHHPNVAGATVLSLGCQSAQVATLRQQIHLRNPYFNKPLLIFDQQQIGNDFSIPSDAIHKTLL